MAIFSEGLKGRLRKAVGAKNDRDLGRKIGRDPGSISQWRGRGSIPDLVIHQVSETTGHSFEWILTGKEDRAPAVREPGAPYGLTDRAKDLLEVIRRAPELLPWLEGLVSILMSGDREKASAIQGNIQAFLEAMGQGRVAEARASPKRKRVAALKKQVSR